MNAVPVGTNEEDARPRNQSAVNRTDSTMDWQLKRDLTGCGLETHQFFTEN